MTAVPFLASVLALVVASPEMCAARVGVVEAAAALVVGQLERARKAEDELVACVNAAQGDCLTQHFSRDTERRRLEFFLRELEERIRRAKTACEPGA